MEIYALIAIILALLIILLLILWRFFFLRNPTPIIKGGNAVISPADGVIARIVPFKNGAKQKVEKGLFGKMQLVTEDVAKEGYLILIMLHVYNIHYQRAPIPGTIQNINYIPGKFLNAVKKPESLSCLFQNERNEILMKGKIKCKVVQIAGFLARRIECFVEKGQKVEKGQELGLINLGSQTAIIVPKIKLNIKEGQRIHIAEPIGEVE